MNYVRERICPKCGNKMSFDCIEDDGFDTKSKKPRWYIVESWCCYNRDCWYWEDVVYKFDLAEEELFDTSEGKEI